MRKFLAVVKHEYKKIVVKWSFLLATLLFPLIAAGFAVVPALIFSIKGDAVRLIIVDQSGKIAPRLKENLSLEKMKEVNGQAQQDSLQNFNASRQERMEQTAKQMNESFAFVDYDAAGKSPDQIRRELSEKITEKQLDAYLLIADNFESQDAKFEFFSRKGGDFITERILKDALNEAIRSQRLADADISEEKLKNLSRDVDLSVKKVDEKGDEKDGEGSFAAAFIVGLMIYLTLLIYGQQILSAVVEEKETRIAEILFSSAKPFELMMGKLIGVGLAGLTQLAIWITSALILVGIGSANMSAAGMSISIPDITPLTVVYFFIFFLLGFFIYATIYALIGSMVTTVQEGGQFAMLPVLFLVIAFYLSFAVIRDPNSPLSFWVSIAPFFAPITMPVRILAETPPFWEIALSILLNALAIAGLIWLAARVYRVGMLMYGKRATIPEVWKWIRQA